MALYVAAAPLDLDATTTYITTGEVSGQGYTARGQMLTNVQVLGPMARAAYLTWDDPIWLGSFLTARGALIYNHTFADAAIAILDFGTDKSSNQGAFRVKLPPPGPSTAVVRLL
jgi:uncharacterized Ntn-hydrolase superfamily protein